MIVVKIQNRNKHKWMRTGGTHILGNPHIYTKSDVARGWKFFTLSRIHIYYMIYIYISEILYIIVCLCIYVQTLCKWPHLASPRPTFKRSTGQIDRCGFTGWIHRRKLNLRWESPRNHGFLRRIFTLW
jgi:hypothetical protein